MYLVPFGIWWLTQLAILTEPLSPPLTDISMQVLQALFTTQMLGLCLLGMLGLAAGVTVTALAMTEAIIATAGLVVLAPATLLQKLCGHAEIRRLALTGLGLAAAILAWVLRQEWLQWVSR